MGGNSAESGRGIAVDSGGNVYTTGDFQVTVDFDPGVGTFELTPAGQTDIFVSKLDGNGDFVWAKSMGGTGTDFGLSIALDSIGNVYTTGFFGGTVDFDPGAGTTDLTSAGLDDIFVSKLDSNGDFVWAKSTGGGLRDQGIGIVIDPGDNIYTTGSFQDTVDFDPGTGTADLTSSGLSDIFISKLQAESSQAMQVTIDIKPGSNQNKINPKSRGRIRVAILSAPDFDAFTMVDKATLTFGRTGSEDSLAACKKKPRDVNHDKLPDLICEFFIQASGFQMGDTVGILNGMTLQGNPITGQDLVKVKKFHQEHDDDDKQEQDDDDDKGANCSLAQGDSDAPAR
jgi:hypothetical protein